MYQQSPSELEALISLLPAYTAATEFSFCNGLPCKGAKFEKLTLKSFLKKLQRQVWVEGLYVSKSDLPHIKRYKNSDGSDKNDFDAEQFQQWVKDIADNTALCEMKSSKVGKGIFVFPGKKIPKGTFIASTGIIKLNPEREELETRVHCSALLDLSTPLRKIYGLIDPEQQGGILDLINHAPDPEELANFIFKKPTFKKYVAISNLRSVIKYYQGYAISGIEAIDDIYGSDYGTQLLWSYARPDEYVTGDSPRALLLFDNRSEHEGEVLDPRAYTLRMIDIFLDAGEPILHKAASLTRWELMTNPPESGLLIAPEDPYSSTQSDHLQSSITHGFLQTYLKQNPTADRIIIGVPDESS